MEAEDDRDAAARQHNPPIVLSADRSNAFNKAARQTIFDHIAGTATQDYDPDDQGNPRIKRGDLLQYCTPAMLPLAAHIKAAYSSPSLLRHCSHASATLLDILNMTGVQQGDVIASHLWNLGMHPILCRVMDRHDRAIAICFADNVYLLGLAHDVLRAHRDLEACLQHDLGTPPNLAECHLHAPAWRTHAMLPDDFRATAAAITPELAPHLDAIVQFHGISVLGCPLGTDSFICASLHALSQKICSDMPKLEKLDDGLAFLHLLRYCLIPRITFALRTPRPLLSRPCAEFFDAAILGSLRRYFGWHTSADCRNATPAQVTTWLRIFTFGAADDGWLGLPSTGTTAVAAYYTAHAGFIRWVTALDAGNAIPDVRTPATSDLPSLRALQDLHRALCQADGIRDLGAPDQDSPAAVVAGPAPAYSVSLLPLDDLPHRHDTAGTLIPQHALTRHLHRVWGPTHLLRGRPAEDQLPHIMASLAQGRAAGSISLMAPSDTPGALWLRDVAGAPPDPLRKIHYRPMAALFSPWVPEAARMRRDELAFLLCQWAGMTAAQARPGAPCLCGSLIDHGGHHLQMCNKRSSYAAAHAVFQDFWVRLASSIPGVRVATTLAQGLPRELGDRGKTPDALITVPQPHGTAGPLLYPSYGPGAQGLVLDFATVHPMHGSANGYIQDLCS